VNGPAFRTIQNETKNMAKYKVVIGTHLEAGKVYGKGAIVNSPLDLPKLFPGKFSRLELAESDMGEQTLEKIPESWADREAPAPVAERRTIPHPVGAKPAPAAKSHPAKR